MLGNLHDFRAAEHSVPLHAMLDVDRYMLHRLVGFTNQVCI